MKATGANLTYQWEVKTPTADWKNTGMTGAKTNILTVPAILSRNGYQFRCKVTSGTETLTSNPATLTVEVPAVFEITEDPADQTVAEGTTVYFEVKATGANLTYQWEVKTPTADWKNTGMTGAKTDTLTVPAILSRNGYQFRCKVTSGTQSLTSKAATLTVQAGVIVEGDFIYELLENSTTDVLVSSYTGSAASVVVPATVANGKYTVKEIGADAFKDKTMIVDVSLPNGIEKIGARAFMNCSSLSSMTCYD